MNGNIVFGSTGSPTLITVSRLEKASSASFMDRSWLPSVESVPAVLSRKLLFTPLPRRM